MNKCEFCDRSILKEGKLECAIADRADALRAIYCRSALEEFKEVLKEVNGKEDKES